MSDPEAVLAWLWKDPEPKPRPPAPALPEGELLFGGGEHEPPVPAGAMAYYEELAPFTMRPDVMAIADDVAPFFELVSVRIGTLMQEADDAPPLPCSACCPEVAMPLSVVLKQYKVHVRVRNVSSQARRFRCALRGPEAGDRDGAGP